MPSSYIMRSSPPKTTPLFASTNTSQSPIGSSTGMLTSHARRGPPRKFTTFRSALAGASSLPVGFTSFLAASIAKAASTAGLVGTLRSGTRLFCTELTWPFLFTLMTISAR